MNNKPLLSYAVESIRPPNIHRRRRGLTLLFMSGVVAFATMASAVLPPPDGGYPNGNTAEGTDALFTLTNGQWNTAMGESALYRNTIGDFNTADGFNALFSNTIGNHNTAVGTLALSFNQTGVANTAVGSFALSFNRGGSDNTAVGQKALYSNSGGSDNTATGWTALGSNTTGFDNVANGSFALYNNLTGADNAAVGSLALFSNTTGNFNTAEGYSALLNNTIGSRNIAVGAFAGQKCTTGDHNIDIGNSGSAGESRTIRIGTVGTHKNTLIAGIDGATVPGGIGVVIDSRGHLGTVTSSKRFKDQIQPMDKASEAVLRLEPVTFRYKTELDPDGIPQFGLVAEQVEAVDPDLVARDDQGQPYSVRYEAVNAMLLNEFIKEHHRVGELEAAVAHLQTAAAQQTDLEATVARQAKEIDALTSQIQRVTNHLQRSESAPPPPNGSN